MQTTRAKPKDVVPGEKIAVIEEFEAGKGTYINENVIRAHNVGKAIFDLKRRVVTIQPAQFLQKVPSVGDEVIGHVETAQGTITNVRIYYVNNKRSQANFTGMIMTRPTSIGGARSKHSVVCKPGDIIKAKVVSTTNAIIHLSIDGDKYGIICAVCSLCGGSLARINSRLKCVDCSNIEDRKIASGFGRITLT